MPLDQQQQATSDAVRVHGEMTIYRAGEVAQTVLEQLRARSGNVNLDLSEVTEFDTAGLQIVLMARRLAEEGGHRLDVVQPSECVLEVLQLCNVALSTEPGIQSQQVAS